VSEQILEPLAACVHCGFCLPACPTYLATGDESDSPRGRIHLMRALARGEIAATDDALNQHLDACLGCRGCEPVCPSGVRYGAGLEAARDVLARAHGLPLKARLILAVFRHKWIWRPVLTLSRWLRATGIPGVFAGRGRLGFMLRMLDASRRSTVNGQLSTVDRRPTVRPSDCPSSRLFTGCVMSTLFPHVHRATERALARTGCRTTRPPGQACCGALHAHAGDLDGARALAAINVRAFGDSDDPIVVNSAGCGAMLKGYVHLLGGEDAARFSERVRDVTELLDEGRERRDLRGRQSTVNGHRSTVDRRPSTRLTAVYDSPCHLQHAQGIIHQPLALLSEVPGLTLLPLTDSDKCCGSAGIFSLLEPAMSQAVLDAKLHAILAVDPAPDLVLTGNPGCLMQIGAGLRARGSSIRTAHPVELLGARHD
jgi:glycolate oxidase iron-sulfur subunit